MEKVYKVVKLYKFGKPDAVIRIEDQDGQFLFPFMEEYLLQHSKR